MSVSFQGSVCVFACASYISTTFLNLVKLWLCSTASLHLVCVLLLLIESSFTALERDRSANPVTQQNDIRVNCTSCKYGRVSKTELWLDLNAEISNLQTTICVKLLGSIIGVFYSLYLYHLQRTRHPIYCIPTLSLIIIVMVSV